jgi:hypothetical protein
MDRARVLLYVRKLRARAIEVFFCFDLLEGLGMIATGSEKHTQNTRLYIID